MKYYTNILDILKEKGIEHQELAKHLGVSKGTMSHWLKGLYEPSLEMILKTADFLDISIDEVIFKRKRG